MTPPLNGRSRAWRFGYNLGQMLVFAAVVLATAAVTAGALRLWDMSDAMFQNTAWGVLLLAGGFVMIGAATPFIPFKGVKAWWEKQKREVFLRSARWTQEIAARRERHEREARARWEQNQREAAANRERAWTAQEEERRWIEERRQAKLREYKAFRDKHRRALSRKRAQLIRDDGYGNPIVKHWEKERRYFVTTVLLPFLIERGYAGHHDIENYRILHAPRKGDVLSPEDAERVRRFDAVVEGLAKGSSDDSLKGVATGHDYEQFCANLLRAHGWQATVTKASGDQGVDIIAEIGGFRIVCQCKFYSSGPVGNRAVQEAVAARLHEQAHAAVVISNAPFTQSAQALAKTTGAMLIHHDEIPQLRAKIEAR